AEAFGTELHDGAFDRVRAAATAPICRSVTLSTMHGCPPEEIESICRYLLAEQKLDTFVKLNPTLLGYDAVRTILDDLGFTSVELSRDGFAHDLQYPDAVGILTRLVDASREAGRTFGVKLTNTLAVRNSRDALPGEEMYLSGRALYPIAIAVAARIAREFDGRLPISYCGGITFHNAARVLATGIRPLTLCTVLLKPGGYGRQAQIARSLESVDWRGDRIDADALEKLADEARRDVTAHKAFRGTDEVRFDGELPATDCYRAPCVEACPIDQHVPEYIRLVGEGRHAQALRLIYERNALPSITGHICDHQCQHACTRHDYEGCLSIRELKKIAVENGRADFLAGWSAPEVTRSERCAVIGAGPAGLASAYFLARAGFAVTVFEREERPGGVVRNVIPEFRLPVAAIEEDIEFIREHGVEFVFGAAVEELSVASLRNRGFGPVVYAIGAEVGNEIRIGGETTRLVRSLDFLWGFRGNKPVGGIGSRVVVVGGGNTAMDAARAAMTLPQVTDVDLLYRRSEAEMPADREEYENAVADGVSFHFLANPESIDESGTVTVREMKLGELDASGRRRPVETDRTRTIHADTVITAIGERVDTSALGAFGVPLGPDGRADVDPVTRETPTAGVFLAGDAQSGPSTVVRCIAAGRAVADTIAARSDEAQGTPGATAAADRTREAAATPAIDLRDRLAALRRRKVRVFDPVAGTVGDAATLAEREYERCLECSYVCNRCVEVCPNRANITVPTSGVEGFSDPFQIVHLDAYCNECGNCAHFCPWSEKVPYRDKPTVFSSRAGFDASGNDGWFVSGSEVLVRQGGAVTTRPLAGDAPTTSTFDRLFVLLHRERPELFEVLS
ncbi:MAG TPA: putative selenate reductase subunit YgfK, partial [Spirochaetia bacterium]|nr:putative selenate reductase subunit YgfK [Spirochaetia bacterium]